MDQSGKPSVSSRSARERPRYKHYFPPVYPAWRLTEEQSIQELTVSALKASLDETTEALGPAIEGDSAMDKGGGREKDMFSFSKKPAYAAEERTIIESILQSTPGESPTAPSAAVRRIDDSNHETPQWSIHLAKNWRLRDNVQALGLMINDLQAEVIGHLHHERSVLALTQFECGQTWAFLIPIIDDILQQGGVPVSTNQLGQVKGPSAVIVTPSNDHADQLAVMTTALLHKKERLQIRLVVADMDVQQNAIKGADIIIVTRARFPSMMAAKDTLNWAALRFLFLTETHLLFDIMDRLEELKASASDCMVVATGVQLSTNKRRRILSGLFQKGKLAEVRYSYLVDSGTYSVICSPFYFDQDLDPTEDEVELIDFEFIEAPSDISLRLKGFRQLYERLLQDGFSGPIILYVNRDREDALSNVIGGFIPDRELIVLRTEMRLRWGIRILDRLKSNDHFVLIVSAPPPFGLVFSRPPLVVQFDSPTTLEVWRYQASRTNHIGHRGRCITFWDPSQPSEIFNTKKLKGLLGVTSQAVPPVAGSAEASQ